jgi:hypothetical protein
MTAKSRGSNSLAGAGPFGFRVPAVGMLPPGYSSRVEQQLHKLCVVGSNPIIQLERCRKQRSLNQ